MAEMTESKVTPMGTGEAGTGGEAPKQYQVHSLYVGDLSPDVSEATLFDSFKDVAPVASVRVCRDNVTRGSLRYAYVNFFTSEGAEKVLREMNGAMINGLPCRISKSQRDPTQRRAGIGNLFVRGLDKKMTQSQLYEMFSRFGAITSYKLVLDKDRGSRGFGFVHFERKEDSEKAISELNGTTVEGREIHVGPFIPRRLRPSGLEANYTNIYVKNYSSDLSTDDLRRIFERYGEITSDFFPMDQAMKPRGFCFFNYRTHEMAAEAVGKTNGKVLTKDGVVDPSKSDADADGGSESRGPRKPSSELLAYVGRAMSKDERSKLNTHPQPIQGTALYVRNIGVEMTEKKLREAFEPYGKVVACRLARMNGIPRGFAYVTFEKHDDALSAIKEMSSRILDNKPLYVTQLVPREVRKTHNRILFSQSPASGYPPLQYFGMPYPPYYSYYSSYVPMSMSMPVPMGMPMQHSMAQPQPMQPQPSPQSAMPAGRYSGQPMYSTGSGYGAHYQFPQQGAVHMTRGGSKHQHPQRSRWGGKGLQQQQHLGQGVLQQGPSGSSAQYHQAYPQHVTPQSSQPPAMGQHLYSQQQQQQQQQQPITMTTPAAQVPIPVAGPDDQQSAAAASDATDQDVFQDIGEKIYTVAENMLGDLLKEDSEAAGKVTGMILEAARREGSKGFENLEKMVAAPEQMEERIKGAVDAYVEYKRRSLDDITAKVREVLGSTVPDDNDIKAIADRIIQASPLQLLESFKKEPEELEKVIKETAASLNKA